MFAPRDRVDRHRAVLADDHRIALDQLEPMLDQQLTHARGEPRRSCEVEARPPALASGGTLQASVANTGGDAEYPQGTPLYAHLPADGLRVLAPVAVGDGPDAGAGVDALESPNQTPVA